MALDALGKFAEKTFTKELNKTVTVTIDGVQSNHSITDENRYARRKFEVSVSACDQTGLDRVESEGMSKSLILHAHDVWKINGLCVQG